MAYTYGAWRRQSTPAAQLAMLLLHIEEVEEQQSAGAPDVASDGKSVQRGSTNTHLARLEAAREKLEQATGTGAADKYVVATVRRV